MERLKQKVREWLFIAAVFAVLSLFAVMVIMSILKEMGFRWGC